MDQPGAALLRMEKAADAQLIHAEHQSTKKKPDA